MSIKRVLEKHIKQIDTIIAATSRNRNITGELARDFQSYVYVKLLENNGKRLTDFKGNNQASWGGYLSVVIVRLAIDFTKKHWGRWENSTAAKLLGEAAMKFESLIYRDKLSFAEACHIMLEIPSYQIFYRISLQELSALEGRLPQSLLDKLRDQSKVTLYSRQEFQERLAEFLDKKQFRKVMPVLDYFEVTLTIQFLKEWDLLFQGRLPAKRSIPLNLGVYDDENDNGLDILENIGDKTRQSPLEKLLNYEIVSQLEAKIDHIIDNLEDETWTILVFYLIENLRISEIARIINSEPATINGEKTLKTQVSSKSWKQVNKQILCFMDELRKHIDTMNIDREDWETVSQYCLYLITQKLEKGKTSVVHLNQKGYLN